MHCIYSWFKCVHLLWPTDLVLSWCDGLCNVFTFLTCLCPLFEEWHFMQIMQMRAHTHIHVHMQTSLYWYILFTQTNLEHNNELHRDSFYVACSHYNYCFAGTDSKMEKVDNFLVLNYCRSLHSNQTLQLHDLSLHNVTHGISNLGSCCGQSTLWWLQF